MKINASSGNKWLLFLGNISYEIYIVQHVALLAFRPYIYKYIHLVGSNSVYNYYTRLYIEQVCDI